MFSGRQSVRCPLLYISRGKIYLLSGRISMKLATNIHQVSAGIAGDVFKVRGH